jgi:catechol-2,3-dioxygenase
MIMGRAEQQAAASKMITLTVTDLTSQINFYKEYVGLRVNWHDKFGAWLGVEEKHLLRLVKYESKQIHTTGQLALKLSALCELSRVVARLCTINQPNEVIDHGFRQSVYFFDGEGNQVELYVEDDQKKTPVESKPFDLEVLFNQLRPDDRLCDGLTANTEIGNFLFRD